MDAMPRIGLLATGAACCIVTIGFLNWYLEHKEQLAWKEEIVEKIVPTEEPTRTPTEVPTPAPAPRPGPGAALSAGRAEAGPSRRTTG